MGLPAERSLIPHSQVEQLREARAVLRDEAAAIAQLSNQLDTEFCDAVELLYHSQGGVIVTGIGKAGLIARKIAATFSSTGTRAHFMHPSDAVHGDLGCIHTDDVVIALSNSGESEEICRLIPVLSKLDIPIIGLTATDKSTLGSQARVTLQIGQLEETGPHGLAPTTSTTAMLALGDALALVLCKLKGMTPQQFATFHPGGSLGKKLAHVADMMRTDENLRIAFDQQTIRQVFATKSLAARRTGAVMLVDDNGQLTGIFTDSDLARILERHEEEKLDMPIRDLMIRNPITIRPEQRLMEAVEILSDRKVSELPVVDGDGVPVGLIDITDVIGLIPEESAA